MDIIEHALKRFNAIVTAQECACDDAYGIHCSIHDDRRFATWALKLYQGRRLTTKKCCVLCPQSRKGGKCGIDEDLIDAIDKHGFVFWVCPNGCKGIVKWNELKTDAVCMECGAKSTDEHLTPKPKKFTEPRYDEVYYKGKEMLDNN